MRHDLEKHERWKKLLSEYKKRETTAKKFCEIHNIKVHQLQYWLNKFKNQTNKEHQKSSIFIKVTPEKMSNEKQANYTLEVNEIKIHFSNDFEPPVLTNLIKLVKACG